MPYTAGLFVLAAVLALLLKYRFKVELRSILTVYLLLMIIVLFSFTVAEMPPFGDPGNPVFNEMSTRYLLRGQAETGAINIASSVILDYRAFDTLGEATILFVAIAAVVSTLKSRRKEEG